MNGVGTSNARWNRPLGRGSACARHERTYLLEDIVVLDLSRLHVVDGDHGLVLVVLLVAGVVLHGAPVARVVHEERVSGLGAVNEPPFVRSGIDRARTITDLIERCTRRRGWY